MDWLSFLVELVGALSWPVTVLLVVLLLRRPLVQLIPNLRRLKYRNIEVDFGKKIATIEREADAAQLPPPDLSATSEASRDLPTSVDQLEMLAEEAPHLAIIQTWVTIEHEARAAMARLGSDVDLRAPITRIFEYLAQQDLVARPVLRIVNELRDLRNAALHQADFRISTQEALEYTNLARRVSAVLRNIRGR